MTNTFQEQAKDRFLRSEAFLRKSQSLIQDDLIYRSALADAVSAIKNMLQGYLLLKIAISTSDPRVQDWQEIAASNRMPDLIRACMDTGLNLRGVDRDIRRMNTDRNQRTHDDPQYQIDPRQAEDAVAVAMDIHKRIREALRGDQRAPAAVALPARQAAFGRPPAQPSVPIPASSAAAATATATAPTTAKGTPASATAPSAAQPVPDDALPSEDGVDDDTNVDLPLRAQRRARIRRVLLNVLAAAVLLIVGAAAGIGLLLPVASAYAPGVLDPVVRLLPSQPSASPTATAQPTAVPTLVVSAAQTLGTLTVQTPICGQGVAVVQLTNTSNATIRWSAAGVDAPSASIAIAQGTTGLPAQFGQLARGASLSLFVANQGATAPYTIVVVGDAGAVRVVVPVC